MIFGDLGKSTNYEASRQVTCCTQVAKVGTMSHQAKTIAGVIHIISMVPTVNNGTILRK
jgi:hypothetical protein